MNIQALLFFVILAVALWSVPRRWAPLPLLVGCCYMTMGQGIDLGPIRLPIFRMLLIVGFGRVLLKREFLKGPKNKIDTLVLWWAVWVFIASFFHQFVPGSGPQYTLGVIFNIIAVYFLFRSWTRNIDEVAEVVKFVAYLLLPVALEMAQAKLTGKNLFAVFGYVPEQVLVRDGSLRAQGPFGHAILAGTVGATCLPLMVGIWNRYRVSAIIGAGSCLFIVFASASSGPVMSLLVGIGALGLWLWRPGAAVLRWTVVAIYLVAELVMTRPAYFLISKIDITGGSTGWHRSRLIQTFIDHFNEWAFAGTDVTRHWIPNGVAIGNGNHIDITNYYISFAVLGGLPSMLLVIAILVIAFKNVGAILNDDCTLPRSEQFLVWSFGACLFGHAATSISVAYFDQSMIFFWLTIAVISSLYSFSTAATNEDEELQNSCELVVSADSGKAFGTGRLKMR